MAGEGTVEAGGVPAVMAGWMDKHREMYRRATKHHFVLSIREGTIDLSSFKRWLVSVLSVLSNGVYILFRRFPND